MLSNNEDFVLRFLAMLIEISIASVICGMIGIGCGFLIRRRPRVKQAMLRPLRLGLWLPFFACWSFQSSTFAGAAAVTIASCYYYIAGDSSTRRRVDLFRDVVLHAFFVFLFSQVWNSYGWHWFTKESMPYAAPVLVVVLILINWIFHYEFESDTKARAKLISEEISTFHTLRIEVVITGALMIIGFSTSAAVWESTATSLMEMSGGLLVSGVAAFVLCSVISNHTVLGRFLLVLLPFTYIVPVIVPLYLLHHSFVTLQWQTMSTVAVLTFYPFVQALWGFEKQPLLVRISLGAENALPYAIVAMLFGETLNAYSGLGFILAMGRSMSDVTGASLAMVSLFLGLSTAFTRAAQAYAGKNEAEGRGQRE